MRLYDAKRRSFIKGTGATAAALLGGSGVLGASASAETHEGPRAMGQPMPARVRLPDTPPVRPSEDSLGFAIMGLGGYALRVIMPRITQARRSHIAALVSGNAEKMAQVGDAYGVPQQSRYSYEDFERITNDPGVDAVYVILPTALHSEFTERAFAAGKHVLCEKPMAISSVECDRMIAAAQRAGKKLMMGYRCHFEPHNLAAMQLMEENALGDLRLIQSQHASDLRGRTPDTDWRFNSTYAGGGPLEDLGVYGLQAALYLARKMPQSVHASAFRPATDSRFSQIFAQVTSQFNFPEGLSAQLSTSYNRSRKNAVEVVGTEGILTMSPATAYAGHQMTVRRGREEEVLRPGKAEVQFMAQLDHLADAVRDGTEIRVPGEMGRRDIRLIEAIYASAKNNEVISLNPDGTMRI